MKNTHSILLLIFMVTISACQQENDNLPEMSEGAETYSLLGHTLSTQELDEDIYEEYRENYEEALADYRADSDDAENIIWLGRRTAYLGQYREAVNIFSEGVEKHPEDSRMYRHRGHRYLTLRLFDQAAEDFGKAADLMQDMDDQIEPDGLPNELNQPTSTLKSNVFYHHGLVEYLREDFEAAIDLYEQALDLDLTNDMKIATLYWYYMALKRNGNDELAGNAIEDINPEIEIIENDAYLNLLLVFKGVFDADRFIESGDDPLQNVTIGYGIGNWHYINGRQDRAYEIWQNMYDEGNWPAFGYIAAEAELARKTSQ
ncbi:MAG: tetratricopeptide repeat protein [Balneolaceae bacterium]